MSPDGPLRYRSSPNPMDDPSLLARLTGPKPLETMSEEEFEDFLTEAIGFYAEHTKTPLAGLRTFSEARLLLKNKGLVVALGRAEFRVTIVKSA